MDWQDLGRAATQDHFSTQAGKRNPHYYGVGRMKEKKKATQSLSEQEIDRTVVSQANDDSAWTPPVQVRRAKAAALSIPANLAARAVFLARAHRTKSVDDWLTRIIRERIELEEAAFVGAKQDLANKAT